MLFKIRNRRPIPGVCTNEQVCQAIESKLRLVCRYRDEAERILEPHCHGHSREGNEVLSAFQLGLGWKMFNVTELDVIRVTEETFEPQEDYNPESPGMTQIHCKV